MFKRIPTLFALALTLVLVALASSCSGRDDPSRVGSVSTPQANELRISIAGMITPKETVSQYSHLLDYISKKTGFHTDLVQTGSYAGINDMLAREEVDVAFICSGGYIDATHHIDVEPLVAPVVDGQPLYYSYVLVRADSGINSFEDLRGRRFAFSDPLSLTGAMYPTWRAVSLGGSLSGFFSSYIFTYNHDNSIKALQQNIVDGAAVDSIVFNYMKKNNPASIDGLKIIETSPPYGGPPVVTRRDLPVDQRNQLLKAFIDMDKDPEGREILSQLGIERFTVVDGSLYNSVRDLESELAAHK